jgi:hypothetical protein
MAVLVDSMDCRKYQLQSGRLEFRVFTAEDDSEPSPRADLSCRLIAASMPLIGREQAFFVGA